MGKLAELMQVDVWLTQGAPSPELAYDNAVTAWGGVPYAQLSLVLVHLRFLAMLHQTCHWVAKGDPFFGDHKFFERLYEETVAEIDRVAEKAVGLGGERCVNLALQAQQVAELTKACGMSQTIPQASDLARNCLLAETNFVNLVDTTICNMDEQGILTPGAENMLQGIADVHEGHVYLLKQRCGQPALGM